MSYNLGFTAGALLYSEAKIYVENISDFTDFLDGTENVNQLVIPTNSESSKKRIKSELDKRLKNLQIHYLHAFQSLSVVDQKIILFLAICKTYTIIAEFALEVVYQKWKTFDYDLQTYDFQYFLSQKLSVEEIDKISENTRYKLSQVAIKIFKEVGIYSKEKIIAVEPSYDLMRIISENNEQWFLNCLMLNSQILK
ncbi:DUF1819 family protein [Candidatus Kaistella beijingensis]|uniref:BrxA family protein n=1 Tax=Candidatus Kaistella beijingensis TaxID=2820270 RepID=UPI001CC757BD|nr:BrxA family protein [Candidatus Kaistella beijingensis]UBB90912.1 DUF1819 family protein [Candidatus Kaistella beijingensis]